MISYAMHIGTLCVIVAVVTLRSVGKSLVDLVVDGGWGTYYDLAMIYEWG